MPMATQIHRPSGAFKLLTTLLYHEIGPVEPGMAPLISRSRRPGLEGYLELGSIRRLSRLLGTQSSRVNGWLVWLAEQGLLQDVQWVNRQRVALVKIRKPENV